MRPAPSSPGGFLKTEPNVRLFVGCVALRRATSSATSALISSDGPRPSAGTRPARRPRPAGASSAGRRGRARRGVEPAAPVGGDDERPLEDRRPVRAVRARVHPHAAAGRPGIAQANSSPPRPAARARCRQTAFVAPPPAGERLPVDLDGGEVALQAQDERVDAVVRCEHVRPEPDRHDGQVALRRPRERLPRARVERLRPRERSVQARRSRSSSAGQRMVSTPSYDCLDPSSGKPAVDDRARRTPRLAHAERHDDVARAGRCGARATRRRRASAPTRAASGRERHRGRGAP